MSCGYNQYGQLGHGDTINRIIFEEIKGLPQNICEVVCGNLCTFIRLTDGKVLSCGSNGCGELGHGDRVRRETFEEVRGIPANVCEIICGSNTFIRCDDGRILSCGFNGAGQLVQGDIPYGSVFEEIQIKSNNTFKAIILFVILFVLLYLY